MKNTIYIISVILVLGLALGGAFLFFRPSSTPGQTSSGGLFGFGSTATNVPSTGDDTNTPQVGISTLQSIFKLADGPIAGAAFTQTFKPTTTVARYTRADNGHVLDIPIGVSGAVARAVSNVTVPGITSSVWTTFGSSTVMQYVDSGIVKTMYVAFSVASSTVANSPVTPSRIRFLPNGIVSFALDPKDTRVAYLLLNSSGGVDGYISNLDGTSVKNVFSLPLSQAIVSWPSANTLLVQTKSAFGVPGVAYSVNATTGALSPLLYAPGLSTSANKNFTKVVYQTNADNNATTYSHDMATGKDAPLVNNPLPEKCVWSILPATDAYCAVPLEVVPSNYMDLWHQGLVQTADAIVNLDTNTGIGSVVTLPGDGGVNSSIEQLVLSPDGNYLMFITRGDQALWGVKLR
ncbi:hypothetical protein A2419_03170 [Candidatus Adlerbacteria bacterium RIFOXYC1_FULL_48_26]|uniref:Uncharacterized protein n=1 Tax=Candidatus Adlerbacteria bacterium RIFOXYC1_FULL_48_26 TaxID=1797247 RepID=A0A1F4Y423_9BACT|nr:MAG: hypothetical protein A2419_03170 [Candidatus Adlerbacteria bacterium RIFOXYC1_FULL_48_26]OGC94513.1 MAG: hypothetical protein A2389_01330 [Candidatus Adlerbacteria bacterium RIFOXYB1_FULL_48_10]OGC94979.1 MAG: hypothetical protein A2590_02760 [Candidatus Adlerbacteria bacterium RIFOXYD1_FULL_48_8]